MIGDPRGWGRVRAGDDTGAIAIFAAIFISFVALVLMAFVMDLGQVYSTQQRLQDAADSAVLAAAQDLPDATAARATVAQYAETLNGATLQDGTVDAPNPLTPVDGNDCAISVTTREYVPFNFGRAVGLNGVWVTATASAAKNCTRSYDMFAEDGVTFNGQGSTGGFIFAGTEFTFNGKAPDLGDFNGIWVVPGGSIDTTIPDGIRHYDADPDLTAEMYYESLVDAGTVPAVPTVYGSFCKVTSASGSMDIKGDKSVGAAGPAEALAVPGIVEFGQVPPAEVPQAVVAGVPPAVVSLSASTSDRKVSLSWTKPTASPAVSGYQWRYRTSPSGNWSGWTQISKANTTTASKSSLTNGTTYDFEVQAKNTDGWSSSASVSAMPGVLPSVPTSLVATPSDGEVVLTWTAPSTSSPAVTSYTVTVSPSAGSVAYPASRSTTGAAVTGLANGTTYTFSVVATNAKGAGPAATVTSVYRTVPGAPVLGTASASQTAITLPWSPPSNTGGSAVTSYIAQYKLSTSSPWQTLPQSGTSGTVSGLTAAKTYDFRVAAVNVVGTGPYATTTVSTLALTAPGAPTLATATVGTTSFTLPWTAPTDTGGSAITGYTAQYKAVANSDWIDASPSGTTRTITVTGLTRNTGYDVRVAARNTIGTGSWATAVLTTGYDAPGAAVLTAVSNQLSVDLEWTLASDGGSPVTGFTVSYDDKSQMNKPTEVSVDAGATSTTITGLTAGTQYYFTIRATNAKGDGPESEKMSAVVLAKVAKPGTPALTLDAGDGSIAVAWTVPNDGGSPLTGYTVQYGLDPDALLGTLTVDPDVTSTTISGLTNGLAVYVAVYASNALGDGGSSGTEVTTPKDSGGGADYGGNCGSDYSQTLLVYSATGDIGIKDFYAPNAVIYAPYGTVTVRDSGSNNTVVAAIIANRIVFDGGSQDSSKIGGTQGLGKVSLTE